MMHHHSRTLLRKVNAFPAIGYPAGTLLVSSTGAGGGFVASPESIHVWVRLAGWPEDLFQRSEFPEEDQNYEFAVWKEDGTFYLENHRLKYGQTVEEAGRHVGR